MQHQNLHGRHKNQHREISSTPQNHPKAHLKRWAFLPQFQPQNCDLSRFSRLHTGRIPVECIDSAASGYASAASTMPYNSKRIQIFFRFRLRRVPPQRKLEINPLLSVIMYKIQQKTTAYYTYKVEKNLFFAFLLTSPYAGDIMNLCIYTRTRVYKDKKTKEKVTKK